VQVLPKARTRVQSLWGGNIVIICVAYGNETTYKHQCITEREKQRVESSENVQFGVVQWILTCKSFLGAERQVSTAIDVCKSEITYQSKEEMKVRVSLGSEHDHIDDLPPMSC
jgi:DnaJ-class molecular chaperone